MVFDIDSILQKKACNGVNGFQKLRSIAGRSEIKLGRSFKECYIILEILASHLPLARATVDQFGSVVPKVGVRTQICKSGFMRRSS